MAVRSTPMSMILHRWFTEDDFLDGSGKPRDLSFDGDGTNFSSLVRQYGGDIPSGAMRTELMRINAIEEMPDGSLKVLKRNVSNLEVHDRIINGLSAQLYPAALAMEHNTRTKGSDDAWIQRSVSTSHVRQDDIARVRRIGSDRLVELTDSIDDLFAAYETLYDKDEREKPTRSVGIGVFYFEEDKAETDIFA